MAKKQPSVIDRSRVSKAVIASVVKGAVTPKSRVDLITELHNRLQGLLRTSIETAMEIGRLLTDQKTELKHGAWLPWVEENLPFDERTAQRYMALSEHRDEITKNDSVSDLTSAYRYVKVLDKPDSPEPKYDSVSYLPPEETTEQNAPEDDYSEARELRQRFESLRDEIAAAFIKTTKIAVATNKSEDYLDGIEAVAIELQGTISMRSTLDIIKNKGAE